MPRAIKTSVAEKDAADIADYISHNNIDAALRLLDAVEETATLLAHWPNLGTAIINPHIVNLHRTQIKGFPNYLMLYRPVDDGLCFALSTEHAIFQLQTAERPI